MTRSTTWRERLLFLFGVPGILINELLGRRGGVGIDTGVPPGLPDLPKDAWNSGTRYRVPLRTVLRTKVSTPFPSPTLGLIVGGLDDQLESTINARVVSTDTQIGRFVHDIEIFTGNSRGSAELIVKGPASENKLLLLVG